MFKKNKLFNLLVLLSLSIFFITGCSDDDNDKSHSPTDFFNPETFTPEESDLYIGFVDVLEEDDHDFYHYIESFIMAINPELMGGELHLNINGEPVEVEGGYGGWVIDYEFAEGETYHIEIEIGNREYSTSVEIPHSAGETNFPEHYNPSQSVEVTWTLANDNQSQLAYANSTHWDHDDWDQDEESGWIREIDSSARRFDFPSNIVTDFGEGTSYELGIIQLNFNVKDRIIAVGMSDRHRYYDYHMRNLQAEERTFEFHKRVLDILK